MNINKRLKFSKDTLKALGLIPEAEEYNPKEHRIGSITIYGDEPMSDEDKERIVIYLGYNQVSHQTTMVLECGTELELKTLKGDTQLIRVRKTGYVTSVDPSIRDKNHRQIFYIPLRDSQIVQPIPVNI